MNNFKLELSKTTTIKGNFDIFQSKTGHINILLGKNSFELTYEQTKSISFLYELEDFDIDNFYNAYKIE